MILIILNRLCWLMCVIFLVTVMTCKPANAIEVDLEIIKQIESGGDPHAYNKHSGATGLYQITKPALDDFNRFYCEQYPKHGVIYTDCYQNSLRHMHQMYEPYENWFVARWYMNTRIPQLLKHFKHEDILENRLISYNCGVGCVGKELPKETINYIKKYKRLAND